MDDLDKDTKLRISRQEGLAPYEKLQESDCVVIGAGAVGRQICQQLAAMGVKKLQIWDFDTVEIENLAPQGYKENQLKANKAVATGEDCLNLNSKLKDNLVVKTRRFAKSDFKELAGKHIFACVDSIDTRKSIYECAIKAGARWLGDSRVAGEVLRIISEENPSKNSKYSKTLFEQAEAFSGSCHGKMFSPGATSAAGILCGMFTQNLRGNSEFRDIMVDMSSWDIIDKSNEV